MKRRDLIEQLQRKGCQLLRHGGKHDIYLNPDRGKSQPIPRHAEINERLAKRILKELIG